jgi:CO/xanthine dehydrogenase FAD-binding subunit
MHLVGKYIRIDYEPGAGYEDKMIIEYQRPKTIPEALLLLVREQPISYPLGGGTYLNRSKEGKIAVVDLQSLGLGTIFKKGNLLEVGATVTLQKLLDYKGLPGDLYAAIKHEATYNLRQMATIAGTLITANGRSLFATIMLALDTMLEIHKLNEATREVKLGDWLPLRGETRPGALITKVSFPVKLQIAYESIARTPADQPIICAAIAQWASGRTRLALGGWGEAPVLAMDGPEADGIEISARNAYSHADDEWASADYRQQMASVLAMRCIKRLNP